MLVQAQAEDIFISGDLRSPLDGGHIFETKRYVTSLGEECEDQYLQKAKVVASMSTERWMRRPAALQALLQVPTQDLKELWVSRLAVPGWVIFHRPEGGTPFDFHWVLSATNHGVLAWPATNKRNGIFSCALRARRRASHRGGRCVSPMIGKRGAPWRSL